MTRLIKKLRDLIQRFFDFVGDTKKELRNVSWPTRQELMGTTIVVIIAVFFFGFFLWMVDLIIQPAMAFIIRLMSS